jgi:hypothetical protein
MHAFTGTAGATRSSRRLIASLLATLGLIMGLVVVATPAQSTETDDIGLFGSQDPTYDGVYRQSYALMGLAAAGITAPPTALRWLLDQQCANGAFIAYREDVTAPCPEPDPQAYTGPDTNSTSLAILALVEHGRLAAARRALAWLERIQLPGGGWGYVEGSPADSVSTALGLEALESVPGTERQQRAAVRWLARQIAPCTASASERFGVRYQPGALPDGISSAQALLGLSDSFPVAERTQRQAAPRVTCNAKGRPVDPTAAVTRWIASTITANDGSIPDPFTAGQADWNSTALGVVAMAATRTSGRATQQAMQALETNARSYVNDGTADRPAALGTLILAAISTGADPEDFGGINLPERLIATLQK